jgi:hypothetical protein
MDGEIIGTTPQCGDLSTLLLSLANAINIKVAAILFIVLIFTNTIVYIEQILANVKGAVGAANQVTAKGSVITSMMICIIYILVDLLVSQGLI